MNRQEKISYFTSVALLLFFIIDPMGILTCKTGTCSISPMRELIGWGLLYFTISEVIFIPLIKFRHKIKLNFKLIILFLALVSILELLLLRYQYFVILNLSVLYKIYQINRNSNETTKEKESLEIEEENE